MPAVVLDSRTSRSASLSVVSVAEGKSSWRSAQDGALELGRGEDLAGDEQRDQRDREDARAAGCRRPSRPGRSGCPCTPSPRSCLQASPDPPHRVQHGGRGSRCRAGSGGYGSGARAPVLEGATPNHGPTHLQAPPARRRRRRRGRRVRQARAGAPAAPGRLVAVARAVLAAGPGSVQLRRAGAAGQHRDAGARARAGRDAGAGPHPTRSRSRRSRPTTRPRSRTRSPMPPRRPRPRAA